MDRAHILTVGSACTGFGTEALALMHVLQRKSKHVFMAESDGVIRRWLGARHPDAGASAWMVDATACCEY